MYCSQCGAQGPDDANFCSNCGREISVQPFEPKPKVHHPWMTQSTSQVRQARVEPPRVQPIEPQPQQAVEPTQAQVIPQSQGESDGILDRVNAFINGIGGWSTKKKIIWGVIAGFLLLVFAAAIAGEPVEDTSSGGSSSGSSSEKKSVKQHELVEEFGCQWIMDSYRPFVSLGRDSAVMALSSDMMLKRGNALDHISTGDAAEALRECEAAGHR